MFGVPRELYKHFKGHCDKVRLNVNTKPYFLGISSGNVFSTIHKFYLIPSVVQLLCCDLYAHNILSPARIFPFPIPPVFCITFSP